MEVSTPVAVALLGAAVTVAGYFVTSVLERRRAMRLRELEVRLRWYMEFLVAFVELAGTHTRKAQERFVRSAHILFLIAGAELLSSIRDLVGNYNDDDGNSEEQWHILNNIVCHMREDLGAPDSERLAGFNFPFIVADLETESRPEADSPT